MRFVPPSRLVEVDTVFAMTVHKSQGSEFAHTALFLPDALNPVLTKELVYTGITRARDWFSLVEACPGVRGSSAAQGAPAQRADAASAAGKGKSSRRMLRVNRPSCRSDVPPGRSASADHLQAAHAVAPALDPHLDRDPFVHFLDVGITATSPLGPQGCPGHPSPVAGIPGRGCRSLRR